MQKRLLSLDVFRGLTVALMILVNNPGSWRHIYAPLRHASWHGWTPTDLVFPFFLFIVGVATSLSFSKHREKGEGRRDLTRKVIRRTILIFAFGLLLNGWPFGIPFNAQMAKEWDIWFFFRRWTDIRVFGVLQRIALAYFAAGLITLYLPRVRDRVFAALGFFALYEILMRAPLVAGWGAGDFSLQHNFVRWFDLLILGENHVWGGTGIPFDPEGIISTLPAVVTTLLGVFVGDIIRKNQSHQEKLSSIFTMGVLLYFVGNLLSPWEPINKALWTCTYVLVTGGLAMIMVVFTSWIVDVKGWVKWAKPAIVFGSNPLVVFVGSGILARSMNLIRWTTADGSVLSVKGFIYGNWIAPYFTPINASLTYAILNIVFWTAILWYLYVKRIFIKI
ncbi:MAG: DUF5009 domain-containing protein [Lentisphaeria bacterium]|nr:DUF5009 domain-containing protein [Lentisphaeria bacterium]